jgi:uncharacterized membrane protein YhaH (DUF805 family)
VYWWSAILIVVVYNGSIFALEGTLGEGSDGAIFGTILMYIPLVWTSLALGIKRYHDLNKSGWWILIGLIPIIGPIWQFVELGFLRGSRGPNRFGDDPT